VLSVLLIKKSTKRMEEDVKVEIKIKCLARTLNQQNRCEYFECNQKIGSMQCKYKHDKTGKYCNNDKVMKALIIEAYEQAK
jgi:hypothetical protein